MGKQSRRHFIVSSAATLGAVAAIPTSAATSTGAQKPEAATTAAMPRRPLGKTGWLISIVGFGGGSQYLAQKDPEVAQKMIDRAIELGVNYFDTAFTYGGKTRESYRRYGTWLTPKYRSMIKMTSKFTERDADSVSRNLEITLKELKTDYIDILHFHALTTKDDVDKILAANGAAKVYRKLKDEGVIKAIGITGHANGEVMMDAIRRIEPDVAMFPLNPAHTGDLSGGDFQKVVPLALERGMGVLAMKTTARNGLIGKNGVGAEELVRYTLNLPVAGAVIGMPSMEVLESCATIARSLTPISDKDKKSLETKLARCLRDGSLPYLAAGYTDGHPCIG